MVAIQSVVFMCLGIHVVFAQDDDIRHGTEISDYRNYLEDLSLIGNEISCTEDEKECYKYNRILHSDGKCYKLNDRGPCDYWTSFYLNKPKALRGEYKGECLPTRKCGLNADEYFMAFDETCYPVDAVSGVCNSSSNLSITEGLFGEHHCKCIGDGCPPRPVVTQPEEPGRCRLPDLSVASFPSYTISVYFCDYNCSVREHECFKKGKIWYLQTEKCETLLQRGPCPDGEQLILNRTAFERQGLLSAMCAPLPCPTGEVFMEFDGRCYKREDVLKKMCAPWGIVNNPYGEAGCGAAGRGNEDRSVPFPRYIKTEGVCSFLFFKDENTPPCPASQ